MFDPNEMVYLGDSVYSRFDGYQVWIWTSNGITNSPEIAIDRDVMHNLTKYWERFGFKP